MSLFHRTKRLFTVAVCALSLVVSGVLPTVANAGMVGTDSVIERQSAESERARIEALLEREAVQDELAAYGIDPAEAKARIDGLSDAEIHQLAGQLGDEPVGESVVGAVVGAAIFVAAVLFFTDLFGVTNVYPFIRP